MERVHHVAVVAPRVRETRAVVRVGETTTASAKASREGEEIVVLGLIAAIPVGGYFGYQAYGWTGAMVGGVGLPFVIYMAYAATTLIMKRT